MSEESPIYGATNDDIIRLAERITNTNQRLQKLEAIVIHMDERIEQISPLLINISARLEALEDKLGDTGDGHSPDRSARVGSVSPLGQLIYKSSPSKRDDQPRHTLD